MTSRPRTGPTRTRANSARYPAAPSRPPRRTGLPPCGVPPATGKRLRHRRGQEPAPNANRRRSPWPDPAAVRTVRAGIVCALRGSKGVGHRRGVEHADRIGDIRRLQVGGRDADLFGQACRFFSQRCNRYSGGETAPPPTTVGHGPNLFPIGRHCPEDDRTREFEPAFPLHRLRKRQGVSTPLIDNLPRRGRRRAVPFFIRFGIRVFTMPRAPAGDSSDGRRACSGQSRSQVFFEQIRNIGVSKGASHPSTGKRHSAT